MTRSIHPLLPAAELRPASPTIVLDVRDRTAFEAGHWPESVHLDLKPWEQLARTPEGDLEHKAVWESRIGALGIDGSRPVVVYDDGRMTEAARTWFILQWYGVEVQVLDGGWPALVARGDVEAAKTSRSPMPVSYRRPASFVPPVGLIHRQALRNWLGQGVQVWDARSHAEHVGTDLRANLRGGHLPGAKWLAHAELLSADSTLKPSGELQERLRAAGVRDDRPVVTHCDAGGRAALAALAAVVAGQPDVHVYYLSFSDWAADGRCPIEKP